MADAVKLNFVNEPDWIGDFTRDQAEGAIPNGTVIQKINSENGDTNPNGTRGIILGSFDAERLAPELAKKQGVRFAYFIEWETSPKCAVGVMDFKVARLA